MNEVLVPVIFSSILHSCMIDTFHGSVIAIVLCYSQGTTEIQYPSLHMCIVIPPTTVTQLSRSLEIPVAQVVDHQALLSIQSSHF